VNRQDLEELERVDTTSSAAADFANVRQHSPTDATRIDHEVSPTNLFAETSEAPRAGSRRLRAALVAGDILSVTAAWTITTLSAAADQQFALFSMQRLGFIPIMLAITMAMLVTGKLYRARMCSVRAVETAGIVRAGATSAVLGWLVAERAGASELSLGRMVWTQALAVLFVFFGRMTYRALLRRARRDGRFTRSIMLVGTGDEAYELHKMLADEPELGYRVVGIVGRAHEVTERHFSVPYLGAATDAATIAQEHGVRGVIVGASSLSFRELNHVVRSLLDAGIHVQVSGGLLGVDSSRLRANPIGREAAFYLEQVQLSGWQSRVKRVLDLVLASFGLLLAAPVIAAFAVWVKKTDGGPAFFKQQRVGRDGKPFTMLKLRTMVVDAEARLAELRKLNERSGPLFKMEHDPRFTKVGKLMDATSINELPQLWNVLKGDMSLVGPRPALAREVATFNDRLLQRHRVKPGITGLWQVESRDDPSFADYERCDLFYVENWSIRLDIMIMLQTFVEVAKRATSRSAPKPTAGPARSSSTSNNTQNG
jgi:exopolysaccharide biosynthesis polyprenyl glycosylphosphotransferase